MDRYFINTMYTAPAYIRMSAVVFGRRVHVVVAGSLRFGI